MNVRITERDVVGKTVTYTTWIDGYGFWLRDKRKRAGLSIRQLAEEAGVSKGLVQGIEEKRVTPSMKANLKLNEALGRQVESINFVPTTPINK